MQDPKPSLFTRHDTFFGVCEALGEDFGFNPTYLRVTLGILILVSPVFVFSAYAGAAVVVVASRLIFPNARPATPQAAPVIPTDTAPAPVMDELAMAA